MKLEFVIFDLDGTLTDSGPGIRNSARYAFEKMGISDRAPQNLNCFIGPPLKESFSKIMGLDEKDTEKAIDFYRTYYIEKGIYENSVYDGIEALLNTLQKNGIKTAVATSKPQPMAEKVIEYFGLNRYFDLVVGAVSDYTRPDKLEVLTEVMEKSGYDKKPGAAVMVGDRKFDAQGARLVGIECIGVNYGFAVEGEFAAEGVKVTADDPKALEEELLRRAHSI